MIASYTLFRYIQMESVESPSQTEISNSNSVSWHAKSIAADDEEWQADTNGTYYAALILYKPDLDGVLQRKKQVWVHIKLVMELLYFHAKPVPQDRSIDMFLQFKSVRMVTLMTVRWKSTLLCRFIQTKNQYIQFPTG